MEISINAVVTKYPKHKKSINDLLNQEEKNLTWMLDSGIKEVHTEINNHSVTDMAAKVVKKAITLSGLKMKCLDQLVFISEGISDYLYMDSAKSIIRKIGGRTNGNIHTSDFFRGSNGTLGIIKIVGNQIIANSDIENSIITSALSWEHHSNNRFLGYTVLGDGAGAILLSKSNGRNQIISIALECMDEYNMVAGFKYGGTRNDFTNEIIHTDKFYYDILKESHLQGILNNLVLTTYKVIQKALRKGKLEINDIDYIGIAGFHSRFNSLILESIGRKLPIINYLETKGYLGTVGTMEILNCFINNEKIHNNSTLLIIAIGIDANVEAMIVRK